MQSKSIKNRTANVFVLFWVNKRWKILAFYVIFKLEYFLTLHTDGSFGMVVASNPGRMFIIEVVHSYSASRCSMEWIG